MKKSKTAFRLISLAMTIVLIFGMFGSSVSAADESDYVAEFRIETDKTSAKAGEDVTVSVYLKTNYYIFAASLVVIYDYQKLTLQNTSDIPSSFLTFEGTMADAYITNGNWQNTEHLFSKRNSNTEFWSGEEAMSKYKAVFASWAGDSSLSELIMLEEEEKILSFTVKANEDIEDFSELLFINLDFLKTATAPQGYLFVGRSETSEVDISKVTQYGQTIIYNGVDPTAHEHVSGEWQVITSATCTSDGFRVRRCTLCGNKLAEEVLYRTGHKYVAEETVPTCTEQGYTTYTCSNCGDSFVADYVSAPGHTEVVDEAVAPDCTNTGLTEGKHCGVCGEIIIGQELVDALGHTEETVTVEATCTEDGSITVVCTICSEVFSTEVIPATGHTPADAVKENIVEPDCVNGGSYDMVVYCSVCGEELSRETSETQALGHTEGRTEIVEPTTEKEGSKTTYCAVCDEVISVEIIDRIEEITASISPAAGTDTVIDEENKLIYGLEIGISSLDGFVTVEKYTLKYTYFGDSFGTGTRVDCILDGEVKETYYVIIFGDLNGDGVVDIYDASILAAMVNGDMEVDEFSPIFLSADLNDDTAIDVYDLAVINSVVNGETEISQTKN